MAATYYKYAERSADSQVNWAEIGKNMSDILLNEAKFREEKKQELDKLSREQSQALAQYPTGQSESARAMALKYSDDASKFMLMQDKLLKSGQMKLSDYTVSRQNLVDDTDTAFTMLKDFQSRYGIKMDRYKKGESQAWELEAMERIEGFGNFSESGMYIDPTSGKVMMSKKEIDPETGLSVMSKDPAKMASIPSVRGMLEGQWDKYNPNDTLDKIKASTGEYMYTIREIGKKGKLGEIKTITDVLALTKEKAKIEADIKIKQAQSDLLKGEKDKKKIDKKTKLDEEITSLQARLEIATTVSEFEKYETDAINIPLVNDWNRLSLMTDSMVEAPNKKTYRFVYSEKDAMEKDANGNATNKRDESAILMVPSLDGGNQFKPQFTDQQKIDSTEWMRTQLRGRYDYKEQVQTVQDYSAAEWKPQYVYEAGQKEKLENQMVQQWMNIFTEPTAAGKKAAVQSLLGTLKSLDAGVIDIDPTDTGVVIKYADGRASKPIDYATGTPGSATYKTGEQWAAAGSILHGVENQNIYNKYKGQTFNDVSKDEWLQIDAGYVMPSGTPTNPSNPTGAFQQFVNFKEGSVNELFAKAEEVAVPNLANIFANTGFTFEESGSGTDKVVVTAPDGTTKQTFELDETDPNKRTPQVQAFKEFIIRNSNPQTIERWKTSTNPANVPADQQNTGAKWSN